MSNSEKAVAKFKKGLNCSQAIIATYGPPLGLEEDMGVKVASAFGGGMGHTGKTCGVLTGALMVIGLHCSKADCSVAQAKARSYALASELMKTFQNRHVYTNCKDLIGQDLSTEEGMRSAREDDLFGTLCSAFVHSAAEILEEFLADDQGDTDHGRRCDGKDEKA